MVMEHLVCGKDGKFILTLTLMGGCRWTKQMKLQAEKYYRNSLGNAISEIKFN